MRGKQEHGRGIPGSCTGRALKVYPRPLSSGAGPPSARSAWRTYRACRAPACCSRQRLAHGDAPGDRNGHRCPGRLHPAGSGVGRKFKEADWHPTEEFEANRGNPIRREVSTPCSGRHRRRRPERGPGPRLQHASDAVQDGDQLGAQPIEPGPLFGGQEGKIAFFGTLSKVRQYPFQLLDHLARVVPAVA
jgi:hypothetical protein